MPQPPDVDMAGVTGEKASSDAFADDPRNFSRSDLGLALNLDFHFDTSHLVPTRDGVAAGNRLEHAHLDLVRLSFLFLRRHLLTSPVSSPRRSLSTWLGTGTRARSTRPPSVRSPCSFLVRVSMSVR